MRPVQILQEAIDEAVAAADWYDSESAGLGAEFSHAVEAAFDIIEENILPLSPLPGKARVKGAKRLILKRFPYDIIIIERVGGVVVVAIAHHSRKPGYWRKRISL